MNTPIYNGLLQSDLDCAGFDLLNIDLGDGDGAAVRKFDVKTYGALGDGSTNDTTAIQAALAAIPSTGGVLYFPAGNYVYSGSTLTLNYPITVEGDGGVSRFYSGDLNPLPISTIAFNSPTVTLFNVLSGGCAFRNISLVNTSSTVPSAGAGILVSDNGTVWGCCRITYDSITVSGFYIDIDVQSGTGHRWANCSILNPVLYGLKLQNILNPDGGDHSMSDCWVTNYDSSRSTTSAIRIESGGGVKIINTKINNAFGLVNGIDLAVASGITTVDLLVANCSIENFTSYGIKGTTGTSSFWGNIVLTGNQFLTGAGSAYAIYLSPTNAGDFTGVAITGNMASGIAGNPAISVTNCTSLSLSGNVQSGFTDLMTIGSGVTFTPVYITGDLRFVSLTGGGKLQARNPGTGAWADKETWTNP